MLPWRACDFKVPEEPFQLRRELQCRHQGKSQLQRGVYYQGLRQAQGLPERCLQIDPTQIGNTAAF